MAVAVASIVSSSDGKGWLSQLVDVIVSKSAEACFVEWIVGVVLAFIYVGVPSFGWATMQSVLHDIGIWPLIAALAVTRMGDTVKQAVRHVWNEATDGD